MKRLLKFRYRNYKNEEADRRVVVEFLDDKGWNKSAYDFVYRRPDPEDTFHPDGGILLSGYDLDKKARRSFELRRIISQITDEEYTDE